MSRRFVRGCVVAALLCAGGCSSVYMKGTPFYTGEYERPQGPPEDRVNIWPILYYHKPALSVMWPVGEYTDDHVALRPLMSVYKLDKPKQEWNFLWPLVQFDFDQKDHRIFPLFWGEDYVVAFPIVWWYDDTKGIFPVFWWKDGGTVFPLAWYQKDKHCHLFPLWLRTLEGEGHDTHALWPVLRLLDTKEKQGWRVWPLAGAYKKGAERYCYALWPLCHFHRDETSITRVAFPFYFEDGGKDKGWWLLLPLALRWKDGEDSSFLTPLWSAGRKGEKRWSALMPLYYYSSDPPAKATRLLTPLVARLQSPEKTRWILVPLLSSVAWGKDEKDLWLLAPFAHARWGGENVQHHVLPLYYYDRNEKLFLTPLVSWQNKKGSRFVNVAAVLANYRRDALGRKALDLIWPFANVSWGGPEGRTGVRLCPLFAWKHTKVERGPAPRTKGTRTQHGTSLWLFPWIYFERSDDTIEPFKGAKGETTVWKKRGSGAFPLWRYKYRKETAGEQEARQEKLRIEFSLLGWLYDYRLQKGVKGKADPRKAQDYVRSRILWRVMHYEQLDGDESLDVFPFITWDRKKDGYRKFSFLWRFYRNERTADGGRNADLFFIPVMRRKGQ